MTANRTYARLDNAYQEALGQLIAVRTENDLHRKLANERAQEIAHLKAVIEWVDENASFARDQWPEWEAIRDGRRAPFE